MGVDEIDIEARETAYQRELAALRYAASLNWRRWTDKDNGPSGTGVDRLYTGLGHIEVPGPGSAGLRCPIEYASTTRCVVATSLRVGVDNGSLALCSSLTITRLSVGGVDDPALRGGILTRDDAAARSMSAPGQFGMRLPLPGPRALANGDLIEVDFENPTGTAMVVTVGLIVSELVAGEVLP